MRSTWDSSLPARNKGEFEERLKGVVKEVSTERWRNHSVH